MRTITHAAIIVLLAVALQACALLERVESSPATAALTVQYGTLKYTGDDADKAQRVYDAVARLSLDDESITLALLDDRIRAAINWERLDLADRLLLDTLLAQVRAELEQRMGSGLLAPEDRVRVQQVMQWVQDAALVAGARSG
jgi:hypothetical protein